MATERDAKPSACPTAIDELVMRSEWCLISSSVRSGPSGTDDPRVRRAQTRAGPDRRRVGGTVAVGPVDAVARRVEIDEVGVHLQARAVVDTESRRDAGAERLQHRIRVPEQVVDDRAALGGGDVDGHALLPLQDLHAAELGERQDPADRVAVELLHLDHPRTQLGEDRRAERRRVVRAELDDRDARQRRRGAARRSLWPAAA